MNFSRMIAGVSGWNLNRTVFWRGGVSVGKDSAGVDVPMWTIVILESNLRAGKGLWY